MILVDKISALTLKDNSTFTGAINPDGQAGTVKLMLESGSTRNLTADAYLTAARRILRQTGTTYM